MISITKPRWFSWAAVAAVLAAAGACAPAWAGEAPGGIDLSAYKGKVVYIDFWASWCGSCKLSFPYMQDLSAQCGAKGFSILAVNVDHTRASADAFVAQHGQGLNVLYDTNHKISETYHVSAMPTSILIGRDGKVRYIHQGFLPEKISSYKSEITKLLNEQ